MPITWSAEVEDVNGDGFVLGLDPTAGSPGHPKASITMSIAGRRDCEGHVDDSLPGWADELVQPFAQWARDAGLGAKNGTARRARDSLAGKALVSQDEHGQWQLAPDEGTA